MKNKQIYYLISKIITRTSVLCALCSVLCIGAADAAVSAENIAALKDNAAALKENKNSTANKTASGLTMAATGVGASQLMQGMAEKKADKEAEADMRALLSSMICKYADGKNFKGGETGTITGYSTEFINDRAAYMSLAQKMKASKEALGLPAGAESEIIFDQSETGLYDDVAIGKQGSKFGSVALALQGNEAEQERMAAQKKEAQTRMIAGGAALGAGVIGGAIANAAINKNAPKNNAEEITKCAENNGTWTDGKCVGGAKTSSDTSSSDDSATTTETDDTNTAPAATTTSSTDKTNANTDKSDVPADSVPYGDGPLSEPKANAEDKDNYIKAFDEREADCKRDGFKSYSDKHNVCYGCPERKSFRDNKCVDDKDINK